MLQRTLKMPSETDKICPYKAGFPIVGCRVFQIVLRGGEGGIPLPSPPLEGGLEILQWGFGMIWEKG